MLIREKLKIIEMSGAEKTVAEYILQTGGEIREMNAPALAAACETSSSTITRLVHRLGYETWKEFREDLLLEFRYLEMGFHDIDANEPFQSSDSSMVIASRLASLVQEAVAETKQMLEEELLNQAAEYLDQARNIYVFAQSSGYYQAQIFRMNMQTAGRNTDITGPQDEMLLKANLVNEKDTAILISYSGQSEQLQQCAQLLHKNHVPVILISGLGVSLISKLADIVIPVCSREDVHARIAPYATGASIQYVLDVLFSLIYAKNPNPIRKPFVYGASSSSGLFFGEDGFEMPAAEEIC